MEESKLYTARVQVVEARSKDSPGTRQPSKLGFFSFESAWRTLQGYEVMNMMRKGRVQGGNKGDITGQIAFISSLFGVAA